MFVFSIRASTIKFFAVLVLTLALLITLVSVGGKSVSAFSSADGTVDFDGVKTNEDRLRFIAQFVPEVSGEAKETVEFSVPADFDRIMCSYNEIQKAQGLDITKYKNKKVTRYTYEIDGYEDYNGPVYINLIIWRGNVIACDISSADPEGFVKPLVKLNRE